MATTLITTASSMALSTATPARLTFCWLTANAAIGTDLTAPADAVVFRRRRP